MSDGEVENAKVKREEVWGRKNKSNSRMKVRGKMDGELSREGRGGEDKGKWKETSGESSRKVKGLENNDCRQEVEEGRWEEKIERENERRKYRRRDERNERKEKIKKDLLR